MTEEPKPDEKKDQIIYELLKSLYDQEFETRGVLDDKGSNLIGYVTIVTGLLIGLGTFEIFDKLSLPEYYIPYFAGIALLLATIVFSMLSVRVKEYKFVPTVDELRKVVDDDNWNHRTIIRQFNTGAMKAIEENHLENERKATFVSLSWGCLISGLVLITIYVSIIATHGKP